MSPFLSGTFHAVGPRVAALMLLLAAAACGDPSENSGPSGGFATRGSGAGGDGGDSGGTGGAGASGWTAPEAPWLLQMGGDHGQYARSIAFDARGNAYVTGRSEAASDLEGLEVIEEGGGTFLAKLDPEGKLLWSRGLTASNLIEDAATVAVQTNGDVVVTGMFSGTLDLGTGPLSAGSEKNETGSFVARFGPDGTIFQSRAFPVDVSRTAFDASGNLLLAASFEREIELGGEQLAPQGRDAVLVKLDAALEPVWVSPFGTPGEDWLIDVAVAPNGDTVAVGAAKVTASASASLLLEVDTNGAVVRSKVGKGPDLTRLLSVAVSSAGVVATVEQSGGGDVPAFSFERFADGQSIGSTALTGEALVRWFDPESTWMLYGKDAVGEQLYVERRSSTDELVNRTVIPVVGYLCTTGLGELAVAEDGGVALAGFFGAEGENGPTLTLGSDSISSQYFDGFFARLDRAALAQ
jgi:hypothetical protein